MQNTSTHSRSVRWVLHKLRCFVWDRGRWAVQRLTRCTGHVAAGVKSFELDHLELPTLICIASVHAVVTQYFLCLVVPIILIFMIDLNRKSTNKKNWIDRKIGKKRSIYSLIDDRSFIYTWQWNRSFFIVKKKNQKIDHGKMKKLIIYDRKSMIGSKNWFLKTDQSIIIENRFLIAITTCAWWNNSRKNGHLCETMCGNWFLCLLGWVYIWM